LLSAFWISADRWQLEATVLANGFVSGERTNASLPAEF